MGEGLERISELFYNGRIGITLGNCFLVDEAFDQSPIGSPVDRAGLPGSVKERSGEWIPSEFTPTGKARVTRSRCDQLGHRQIGSCRQQAPPIDLDLALPLSRRIGCNLQWLRWTCPPYAVFLCGRSRQGIMVGSGPPGDSVYSVKFNELLVWLAQL